MGCNDKRVMRVWGSALVGAQVLLRSSVGKKLIAPTLITPVHHYCSCLPCRRVISSQKKRLFRGKVPTTVAVSHTTQQRKGTPPKVIVFLAQILVETILRSKFSATASHASSQTSCTRLFWQVVDGRVAGGKGAFLNILMKWRPVVATNTQFYRPPKHHLNGNFLKIQPCPRS